LCYGKGGQKVGISFSFFFFFFLLVNNGLIHLYIIGMWKIKIMVPLYLGFFTGAALGMLALTRIEGKFLEFQFFCMKFKLITILFPLIF